MDVPGVGVGPGEASFLKQMEIFGDPEAFVPAKLFELGLGATNLLQAAFFPHIGEGRNFGYRELLGHVIWHDI